ncbi:hypothetical protein Q9L58_010112 [Maublancomyces gigas]|uniref:Uncharacterized protein n=1 Tax=Discina gigas TaxID=1032678 RepID=A0ABR3G5E2_9PEZI
MAPSSYDSKLMTQHVATIAVPDSSLLYLIMNDQDGKRIVVDFGARLQLTPLPHSDPYYAGVGSPDPTGKIVATAVFQILPGVDYIVTPVLEYWLSVGDYKAGEIVDVGSTGPHLQLDFSDGNDLVYTLNNKNEYIRGRPP